MRLNAKGISPPALAIVMPAVQAVLALEPSANNLQPSWAWEAKSGVNGPKALFGVSAYKAFVPNDNLYKRMRVSGL